MAACAGNDRRISSAQPTVKNLILFALSKEAKKALDLSTKLSADTRGLISARYYIDSIAKNGIRFTDHYGQPSCTAGRAAFIMVVNVIPQ